MNRSHVLQRITPEKAMEQFQILLQIELLSRLIALRCQNLDMDFKRPDVHQRIGRMTADIAFIKMQLRTDKKYNIVPVDEEYAEDATGELDELFRLAPLFGKEGLAALNGNLQEQIDNAKKQSA
jgi:hypothetical protein